VAKEQYTKITRSCHLRYADDLFDVGGNNGSH
jgi:hypothetical protein